MIKIVIVINKCCYYMFLNVLVEFAECFNLSDKIFANQCICNLTRVELWSFLRAVIIK